MQKIVYVVLAEIDWGVKEIIGIFTTEEEADEVASEHTATYGVGVYAYELNKEENY